jgi:Transglutaminase-like superfamily
MARYGLARHVFLCRDEEYLVVLDLKRDRYFTLEAATTAALRPMLPGWPVPAPENAVPDSAAVGVATPLLRRGWLLEGSADSKDAAPVRPPLPEVELASDSDFERSGINLGMVLAFASASLFAKLALRFWRFERVIQRVARRKVRRADANQLLDMERARQLIDAFGRMRAFLFSSRDECLHDSLAVIEFLARYGLFPSWVFGVRARPFEAHCWVQHAGIVFNDTVEQVGAYVPIMVV